MLVMISPWKMIKIANMLMISMRYNQEDYPHEDQDYDYHDAHQDQIQCDDARMMITIVLMM